MLLLYHAQAGTWLCWHRWTETSMVGPGTHTTQAHSLTSYFKFAGGSFPDLSVERRSAIGGLLKARRGAGTGDEEFDRRFVVKPTGSPQAARVVTPRLAQALITGEAPNFAITSGVVITSYRTTLDLRHVPDRAAQIGRLAQLLGG